MSGGKSSVIRCATALSGSTAVRKPDRHKENADERWVNVVCEHVEDIKFGVVQIVVHESRVTQVERIERVRFERQSHDYEI
jgi:hypothetical protein